MRTRADEITDKLLTLRAIQIASNKTRFQGRLMLQKIIFVAGHKYREAKERVLGQSFYRWDYGPMSDDVYRDVESLEKLDLITGELDKEIKLTERGKEILRKCEPIFSSKRELLSKLDETAINAGNLNDLLDKVYSMETFVEEMDKKLIIRDIPEGKTMLSPLWENEADLTLRLDNSWLETLDLMLDPEVDAEIQRAMEDARKGRVRSLEII